jgi:2-keto-4-pentenoate hydratase/2-oxohepta-3-ene-1,7-dioic acid hydratase in catechol pathway
MDYVFGFTVAHDVSARDWQFKNGGQFLLGKAMDGFCPLGPAIVMKEDLKGETDLFLSTPTII